MVVLLPPYKGKTHSLYLLHFTTIYILIEYYTHYTNLKTITNYLKIEHTLIINAHIRPNFVFLFVWDYEYSVTFRHLSPVLPKSWIKITTCLWARCLESVGHKPLNTCSWQQSHCPKLQLLPQVIQSSSQSQHVLHRRPELKSTHSFCITLLSEFKKSVKNNKSNLFSPFPIRSSDYPCTDSFHHKSCSSTASPSTSLHFMT